MTADLPPVGATVRTRFGATGTVEHHASNGRSCFLRWPLGGGMWVTADEIDEVLPTPNQAPKLEDQGDS